MRRRLPALLLAAAASCAAEAPDAAPEPPSLVVLVSLDTVRADRLGAYGYERSNTPHLATLAADGVRFETVGAQASHTLPSHKSLFTAKYPLRLLRETTGEALADLDGWEKPQRHLVGAFRDLASESLVSSLQRAGYRTAAFTDDVWVSREMGFDEGFDAFDGRGGHFAAIVPRVAAWLGEGLQGPTFLFVHAYDAHCPYTSREPFDTLFCDDHGEHLELEGKCAKPDLFAVDLDADDFDAISDHYDAGIASADAYVGDLVELLRAAGLYDECLLVVTSDHGESLGEEGRIGHGGLHVEELLVPLVVKPPASWGLAGRVVREPVALLDVLPTIVDACGAPLPPGLDGRSLLPLLSGEGGGRDLLVAQFGMREGPEGVTSLGKRAVLDPGRWLAIEDLAGGAPETYDLSGGAAVRAEAPAEVLGPLLAALAERDRAEPAGEARAVDEPEMTEAFKQRLESLGYADEED